MFLYRNVHKFQQYKHVRYVCKATLKSIPLEENTLTGRLLQHVRDLNLKNASAAATAKAAFDAAKGERVLREIRDSGTQSELTSKLNYLNAECCNRISDLDPASIFNILNIYVTLAPNGIVNFEFYGAAIAHLNEYFQFLSVSEVLQLIFYVGLQKKTRGSEAMLKQCLRAFNQHSINELSVNELCIICNSTFKCSTKIKNEVFLAKIIGTINDDLSVLKDPAIFLTLVKTLRHNRAQNENLLSTISCAMLFNSTYQLYNFAAMCHVLALFADFSYYDENILDLFKDRAASLLRDSRIVPKTTYISENIRPKDIKRFLWVYSSLGYKLERELLEGVFVKKIQEKIANKEYDDEPDTLLDSILYFWILNYQAVQLIPYCFREENIRSIQKSKTKSKEKLNILLSCIQLENLALFKELQLKPQSFQYFNVKQQLTQRPNLQRVFNALKALDGSVELNRFECECQIPHVKIVGITGYKKNIYKSVFVEVLDDYVCVKNKADYAAGPMQLKLRLLDNMDQGLIIVSTDDLNTMTDEELKDHLVHEINMIC